MEKTEPEQRYRIILGDNCEVCRAASRISFPADRPPVLPIAGCRNAGGCHCRLPVPAPDEDAAELAALDQPAAVPAVPVAAPVAVAALAPAAVSAAPVALQPVETPEWQQPAPITQQRRRVLQELTDAYQRGRIQGIRIDTAPHCCPVCAEVAESIYAPSIAPPVPIVGCVHGWRCSCTYAAEPLPLDARGQAALRRLEQIERERTLRRRGVARGGPRWLHLLVVAASLATLVLALRLVWSGAVAARPAAAIASVAALLCVLVAQLALRRYRPLPAPPRLYELLGLAIAVAALWPFLGVRLPAGLTVQHLDQLSAATMTPVLPPLGTAALLMPPEALALAGLLLLLLGALAGATAAGYERRALARGRRVAR